MELIDKATVIAEIKNRIDRLQNKKRSCPANTPVEAICDNKINAYKELLSSLDILEVIDPYEQRIQYASVKSGIKAHAETYAFNIESSLFNLLDKEQQELWRKEIEQAVISGGEAGVELAGDLRYKENLEVKEVDFDEEFDKFHIGMYNPFSSGAEIREFARHFYELGLKAQKGK